MNHYTRVTTIGKQFFTCGQVSWGDDHIIYIRVDHSYLPSCEDIRAGSTNRTGTGSIAAIVGHWRATLLLKVRDYLKQRVKEIPEKFDFLTL